MKQKTILVIAAHPDDEVLGCAGTIVKLASCDCQVYTLILGEGITSRFHKKRGGLKIKELNTLRKSINEAAKILRVKRSFIWDFPDNRFDTVAMLDIVKVIERVKTELKPEIVYTHHRQDLNIDHRITYDAVLTACRPLPGETVREIYSFQIPSSTEWLYPYSFNPNIFVDITETINKKIEAMKCYITELRDFPHPRSIESIETIAKHWGSAVGLRYAEPFEAVRIIKE